MSDYIELSGDALSAYLDAPPLAECGRCHRKTWSPEEVGQEDRMPQPDGYPCGGRFSGEPSEPELPAHRVAVTVFATVRAVDERDAGHIVTYVLRHLIRQGVDEQGVLPWFVNNSPRPVFVADVMDTGMAAGNGYLWLKPTAKSFRESGGVR